MPVKTPLPEPPWKQKAQWAGAAVLCAMVLAALLITALRVRGQKLAARGAEAREFLPLPPGNPRLKVSPDGPAAAIEEFLSRMAANATVDVELDPASPPRRQEEVAQAAARHAVSVRFVAGDARAVPLTLRRGERIRFEDFTLQFRGDVSVHDAKGRPCVAFTRIEKGQVRRWQELQISFSDAGEDRLAVEVEIGPSAPCFGPGAYIALRTGLRVEFPGKRAVTITAWDPGKPGISLRLEGEGRVEERTVGDAAEGSGFGLRYRFGRTPAGEPQLDLDASE